MGKRKRDSSNVKKVLAHEQDDEPDRKRQPPRAYCVDDLGIHTRVVAALSLGYDDLWRQLSNLVVEELAGYVKPSTFGAVRVVLPEAPFYLSYLSAQGDEVFFGDDNGLAVFRDGAVQRHIGDGLLRAEGSAVVADTAFVASRRHSVAVYPLAGGACVRRFGAPGRRPGEMFKPQGLAVCGGRVFVAEWWRVSVFTTDGGFVAHACKSRQMPPCGVAASADEVFVVRNLGDVAVVRADTLAVERRFGGGTLRQARDISVNHGLVFVSDHPEINVNGPYPPNGCIVAFDLASGERVASIDVEGTPSGVAVTADGVLFFAAFAGDQSRLCAVQML